MAFTPFNLELNHLGAPASAGGRGEMSAHLPRRLRRHVQVRRRVGDAIPQVRYRIR